MQVSFVKSLFKEPWDEYQLRLMENGGNYHYIRFMHYYELKCKDVHKKMYHKGSQWWALRLRAIVDGRLFNVPPPEKIYTSEEFKFFTACGIDPNNFMPHPNMLDYYIMRPNNN